MKKLFLGIFACLFYASFTFAQTNNPYNQLGADVVTAAKAVYLDYQSGKLNNVTQETLDFYLKKFFPKYGNIPLENFNRILTDLKNSDNNSIIKNAKYSDQAKAFLQKTLEHYSITQLVDEVQKSEIAEDEKKDILCVLAINYNLIKPYFDLSEAGSGKGALVTCSNSEPVYFNRSNGINAFVWGGIGFAIGSSFGGVGGVIGGLVGLVVGGWMDEKGIRPVITTSSGGGGYNGGSGGGWGPQP